MPDYREMYLQLCRATEQAITVLIESQQKVEDLYLSETEQNVSLLPTQMIEEGFKEE